MKRTLLTFTIGLMFAQAPAQLTIPAGNDGPEYFYPADPAERLYKLPYAPGKSFEMYDGYYNDPLGHPSWSNHPDYAMDFRMPEGEPIHAVRGGRVMSLVAKDSACNLAGSDGNWVVIGHVDSIPDTARPGFYKKMWTRDWYNHISRNIPVKLGDRVVQGQVIAYASCTGWDGGGAHLHFEVNMDGHTGANDTGYTFTSVPTPFVEVTANNGFLLRGDRVVSRNVRATRIEASRPLSPASIRREVRETAMFNIHGKRISAGSRPPAGIYFKRLESGRFKKVVFMP